MGQSDVLIVWGGLSVHEPEITSRIVAGLLEAEGLSVDVTDDLDALGSEGAADRRLIIPNITGGSIEARTLTQLIAAVRGGVGLGGYHAALATTFPAAYEFHYMTGCQWVAHPGNIRDYDVVVRRTEDPIMAGIDSFPYRSEQYFILVDPGIEVLATTTFDDFDPDVAGVVMPVVYKRRFGAGRVFYSALGHNAGEFEHSEMRTILTRGLLWAARR